ncbi:CBS domain-containing protein [Thermocrinis sp.]
MKEIELSEIATYVPTIEYDFSIREALKVFDEYGIYDTLVVVRNEKPIGVVSKRELLMAQHRLDLSVGDVASSLPKVRSFRSSLDKLEGLFDFFTFNKKPLIVVNKDGTYAGLLFYHVLLHYFRNLKETVLPIFQKLRRYMGEGGYFYSFQLKEAKKFKEQMGTAKLESLYKLLLENVKDQIEGGDTFLSIEDGEVYALSHTRVPEDKIKLIMEEFHREFSLLYAEAEPVHILGFCLELKNVKNYEEFFSISSELKGRLRSVPDISFFIHHGIQPSVVVCEYRGKEYINRVVEKIKEDFSQIIWKIRRTEKEMWEYTLYEIFKTYPYFEIFYIINEKGIQISNNVINPRIKYPVKTGRKGADRTEKPYYKLAKEGEIYISGIYISQATDDFCITLSSKFRYGDKAYVLAGDINYTEVHKLVKSYSFEYTKT